MKNIKFLIFLIFILNYTLIYSAQSKRAFFKINNDFSNAPCNNNYNAVLGFDNPANLYYLKTNITKIYWSDSDRKNQNYNNWAIFTANSNIGLSLIKENENGKEIYNSQVSFGAYEDNTAVGFAYGWGNGDGYFKRNNKSYWILGVLYDISPFFNMGGTFLIQNFSDYKEETYYFIIKPFSDDNFSLSYKHAYQSSAFIRSLEESYGAYLKFLERVVLTARFYNNGSFNAGINISIMEELEVIYNSFFKSNNSHINSIYGVGVFGNGQTKENF